jgi:hypothetical protein
MSRKLTMALTAACAIAAWNGRALAGGAPAAAAQPSPAASAAVLPTQPPQIPFAYDPCGGPGELLAKYGLTPCVVVGGEALLSAGYTSSKIDERISIQSKVLPPVQTAEGTLARTYPQAQAIVGLGPFSDITIVAPTYTRLDTDHFPLLVSGDTDWKTIFKQRIASDPLQGMVTSVDAGVEFPTGSPPLRAAAPVFSFDLVGQKAWPNRLVLLYDMNLVDAPAPSGGRAWSLSPTILGMWSAPGNFLTGAGAIIQPNGKVIPTFLAEQLFNRHFGIALTYAGMGASGFTTSTQPDLPVVSAITVNGNVNVITLSLIGLIGKSGS